MLRCCYNIITYKVVTMGIYEAVRKGDLELIKVMLKADPELINQQIPVRSRNIDNVIMTPLHYAASEYIYIT